MRRARLIGAACNKLPALHQALATLPETPTKAIVCCGDGRTTDAIAADEIRQIQAVARLLGEQHGLRVRDFTSRKTQKGRDAILRHQLSGFRGAALTRNPTPNSRRLIPRFDGCRRPTIK